MTKLEEILNLGDVTEPWLPKNANADLRIKA